MTRISRVGKLSTTGRPKPSNSKCVKIFRPRDSGWYGDDWKSIAAFVKKRDNYTCLAIKIGMPACEKHLPPPYSRGLAAHHIVPLPKGSNDPSNLITLCHDCHSLYHNRPINISKERFALLTKGRLR